MSTLQEALNNAERHVDYHDRADVPNDVFDVLRELQAMRGPSDVQPMARADALAAAREHVEAISTNSRGYQDGVRLADKVQAVDTFARFLMGESE